MGQEALRLEPEPYPALQVEGKNLRYARAMLGNAAGVHSELSTVSTYVYSQLMAEGEPAVAEAFHRISVMEMHHLYIFTRLAQLLGEQPRMWSWQNGRRLWWTPAWNRYPQGRTALLQNALRGERETIARYRRQTMWIEDGGVLANLERIIRDEEEHVRQFAQLLGQ